MGHYDGRDLPFYWNVADEYVLFDRFFAASPGGSVSNHLFWVTGTPGDPRWPDLIPPGGFRRIPTIFDRLERARHLLEVLRPGLRPAITYRSTGSDGPTTQATWVPLLTFPRSSTTRPLRRHIVDLAEYYTDPDSGTLPAVAFIVPAGSSEHPPGRPQAGQTLVRRIVSVHAAQPAVAVVGVPVDLRRLGRLVRPRAAAEGPRLPRPGPARQRLRAPRPRRPHAAGHDVGPAVHRGQLAPARAAPDRPPRPDASSTPSTSRPVRGRRSSPRSRARTRRPSGSGAA